MEPLKVMTMAEIQTYVAKQPAVLRAWTSVKNKFVDLDKKYEFAGFAVAMEICTRTWKDKRTSNFTFTRGSCRAREHNA